MELKYEKEIEYDVVVDGYKITSTINSKYGIAMIIKWCLININNYEEE